MRLFFAQAVSMLVLETEPNQSLNNERWRKSKLVWLTWPEFRMGDRSRKSQNSVLGMLVLTNANLWKNCVKLLFKCPDPNESVYS